MWRNFPDEIDDDETGTLVVAYSCVRGGWEGDDNIDFDPRLTRDRTRLLVNSPCRDAGNPEYVGADLTDIDGEPRIMDARVDIGCDEFHDTDTDALPDNWEASFFGSPTAGEPTANADGDAWNNLAEYEKSGNPIVPATTYYVDVVGDDAWDGLAPDWDGTHGPKLSIRAALALTDEFEPDEVVLAPGIHVPHGTTYNMLNFGGKPTILRSVDPRDPDVVAATIIDRQASAEHLGLVFYFSNFETTDSIVTGLTIRNGYASLGGAARCLRFSNPCFSHCVFVGNHATINGGAIHVIENSAPVFQNCIFAANTASTYGGVVYASTGAPVFSNCLFVNNQAIAGGGFQLHDSNAAFDNCTFVANSTPDHASCTILRENDSALVTLTNCVFWNEPLAITTSDPTGVEVFHSLVQGGWPGVGNVDADPLFADPDGPDDDPATWEDNDYRLTAGSPCIDAGDNAAVPLDTLDLDGDGNTSEPLPIDLAGGPRFLDDAGLPDRGDAGDTGLPVVDMGAYEFEGQTCFGDLDGNGLIDLADLAHLLGRYGRTDQAQYRDGDLDADGDVDLADLAELLGRYGDPCS